jgi:2-oxoglutarate dehydrogenase E1 component
MHRSFRKPLIVMTPKSLLRHPLAISPLADFTAGGFRTVLDDIAVDGAPEAGVTVDRARVTRLLLCSGKIYYALLAARRDRQVDWASLVRVEQLYPFPFRELEALLARYPEVRDVYWVQEEPWNMGAWHFVEPRLRRMLAADRRLSYVGRAEASSPATGSYKIHQQEEAELVNRAFAR